MLGGLSGWPYESIRKQERDADRRLHANKMKLLEEVARVVNEAETRSKLSKNDPLVRCLRECSGKEVLLFKGKLSEYANEMEGCTAYTEARLARLALDDLNRGDYHSSRLKRYETLLMEIIAGK